MHLARLSLLLALFAASACGARQDASDDDRNATPPPNLPVTMEAARQAALARVPGQVQEEELEEEQGRWVYEFDIASGPGQPVTEVMVDATSGQVVEVEVEQGT